MSGVLDNVKVGDKLFINNGMCGCLEKVVRLTKTLVITDVHRFNRSSGKLCGDGDWDARIATAEDIAMITRQQMIRKCDNIDFSLLTTAQLERILEIVNPIPGAGGH